MYFAKAKDSTLNRQLKQQSTIFLHGLSAKPDKQHLKVGQKVYDAVDYQHCYLIDSGSIDVTLGGRLVYVLEAGDFFFAAHDVSENAPIFEAQNQAQLTGYDWRDIKNQLRDNEAALDAWLRYQGILNTALTGALSFYCQHSKEFATNILNFNAGETIIEQGSESSHVYTLIDGHAEAFQGNTKVGDIYIDEIFGTIAAFTNRQRSATVRASEDCTVQAIHQDDFVELIRLQPQLCRSLIENLSRQITDLNDVIASTSPADSSN